MSKPRILFMGTPEFAVPALRGLLRCSYPVIGVVTQPDRPSGRGLETISSPVKALAQSLSLPIFQPEKLRDSAFLDTFRKLMPDLVVVSAFGQILPAEVIHGPKEGCINIHPSLLPKYRGSAPINRAIINGDRITGVTIMRMDEGVDSGDILLQKKTTIGTDESFGELHDRLAEMGAEMLLKTLEMLTAGTLRPQRQDSRLATAAPRLTREEGLIRWDRDCRSIVSLIRGLSPVPGAFTFLDGKQLKIFAASAEPATVAEAPGTITGNCGNILSVATKNGYVRVLEVQLAGKKRMSVGDFLRGCRVAPGQIIG